MYTYIWVGLISMPVIVVTSQGAEESPQKDLIGWLKVRLWCSGFRCVLSLSRINWFWYDIQKKSVRSSPLFFLFFFYICTVECSHRSIDLLLFTCVWFTFTPLCSFDNNYWVIILFIYQAEKNNKNIHVCLFYSTVNVISLFFDLLIR